MTAVGALDPQIRLQFSTATSVLEAISSIPPILRRRTIRGDARSLFYGQSRQAPACGSCHQVLHVAHTRRSERRRGRPQGDHRSIDRSLSRLKTDYVDLYWQTHVGPAYADRGDAFHAQRTWVRAGKVRNHWHVERPRLVRRRGGRHRAFALAGSRSRHCRSSIPLLTRTVEGEQFGARAPSASESFPGAHSQMYALRKVFARANKRSRLQSG